MNHQKIYDQIIERATLANRKKVTGGQYFEEHHIIPKCLGGDNSKGNKVLLTAREHFICHKLLVDIYPNNRKLIHGFRLMVYYKSDNQLRDFKISSREFERIKVEYNDFIIKFGGVRKGTRNTKEQNFKISNSHKGIGNSNETRIKIGNANRGKTVSKESRDKMSNSKIGDKHWAFGKVMSEESKNRRKLTNSLKPFIVCQYCGIKCVNIGNFNRYHDKNCKLKFRK